MMRRLYIRLVMVCPIRHLLRRWGEITESDGTISFDVTVTNTGDVAGKDVVEVYYNPPYTNGGIEKASANLIAFEKTGMLEPGASETVTISFKAEDMASYDYQNAKAYVLEAGNYEISINSDSHNVIDSRTYNVPETITYSGENGRSTDAQTATNVFDYAAGEVTYLSRAGRIRKLCRGNCRTGDIYSAGRSERDIYQQQQL